jgi:hypothetical protein
MLCAAFVWIAPALEAKEVAVNEQNHALTMKCERAGDHVEIVVNGHSTAVVKVNYLLEIVGSSTTCRAGSTQICPAADQILSRVRLNASDHWTATLTVKQSDGLQYVLKSESGH